MSANAFTLFSVWFSRGSFVSASVGFSEALICLIERRQGTRVEIVTSFAGLLVYWLGNEHFDSVVTKGKQPSE